MFCPIHSDEKKYKPLEFGKEVNGYIFGYCSSCQGLIAIPIDKAKVLNTSEAKA